MVEAAAGALHLGAGICLFRQAENQLFKNEIMAGEGEVAKNRVPTSENLEYP